MNKEEFIKEVAKLGLSLSEDILNKLNTYCQLLTVENKKYNLTAITDEKEIYLKHFYDSLTIIKTTDLTKYNSLLDIGTGAGFPGGVLAIFFPNLMVTLLDSNNKKISFLLLVKEKLKLNNIFPINKRAEEYIEGRESFDLVTARAVASLRVLMEISIPFVKVQGYFIAMKGKENEEELAEGIIASKYLKCNISSISKFNLQTNNGERTIINVLKEDKTPSIYPREYSKIVKNPLK